MDDHYRQVFFAEVNRLMGEVPLYDWAYTFQGISKVLS